MSFSDALFQVCMNLTWYGGLDGKIHVQPECVQAEVVQRSPRAELIGRSWELENDMFEVTIQLPSKLATTVV